MASGRGFVMAKFYEASAYRNTPGLSTPSLDEVAWTIFCGYFVALQAALSSFIFTIIVDLVEWILVHNYLHHYRYDFQTLPPKPRPRRSAIIPFTPEFVL